LRNYEVDRPYFNNVGIRYYSKPGMHGRVSWEWRKPFAEQAEGVKYNPGLMLIDDADRPAKWYFELKQALSQQLGAFLHYPIATFSAGNLSSRPH
jgi:hypothetical protein